MDLKIVSTDRTYLANVVYFAVKTTESALQFKVFVN